MNEEEVQDVLDRMHNIPVMPLREFRVIYVLHAIEQSGGYVDTAAEALEVDQSTMYRWLKSCGLHTDRRKKARA